jgi:hypothetical protein
VTSIYDFVKQQRDNYRSQTIEITDGYEFSQYQTIRTIELYHNSKFTSGNKDSLGREKPFYNITKFRVNVGTRATDLDAKNVQVFSDNPAAEYGASFLHTLKNWNWMKQSAFESAWFQGIVRRDGFSASAAAGKMRREGVRKGPKTTARHVTGAGTRWRSPGRRFVRRGIAAVEAIARRSAAAR